MLKAYFLKFSNSSFLSQIFEVWGNDYYELQHTNKLWQQIYISSKSIQKFVRKGAEKILLSGTIMILNKG